MRNSKSWTLWFKIRILSLEIFTQFSILSCAYANAGCGSKLGSGQANGRHLVLRTYLYFIKSLEHKLCRWGARCRRGLHRTGEGKSI